MRLKKAYENSNRHLWQHPMTYEEYLKHCEDDGFVREAQAEEMKPDYKDHLVNTAENLQDIFSETEMILFPHPKYAYPIIHNHKYVEIVYVCFGQCTHFVEDSSFEMKQGDLCIMSPNTGHAVSVTNDDTFVLSILASEKIINRSFIDLLRGDYILTDFFEKIIRNKSVSNYILFQTGEDLWMQKTTLCMCEEFQKKSYIYEKSITLYVELIFIHLIRHYEMMAIVSNDETKAQNENIVAILGYLSVNYATVTLKQTADFFGYTSPYLSKLIKKYTGHIFTTIITDLQMTNAKRYLDDGEKNITEIAYKVGCFDTSHFGKKFKAKYGVPPTEYKRESPHITQSKNIQA